LLASATPARVSFAAFLRALFAGRRKKVRHSVQAAAAAAGLPFPDAVVAWPAMQLRPSQMSVAALVGLWREVRAGS
jgi:16S rRNA A1518/A1519 N6-dimethyltransferase RsmA/KsgA/DIM1 with predicted DNA glycosylase/AP lyase activity